jgi:hypothetical protein
MAKNTAQVFTLFMLSNLWMVRKKPSTGSQDCVRPKSAKATKLGTKVP